MKNLNSQIRDKISYLVRKTKAYPKSFKWLRLRLAIFFIELNLKGHKIHIQSVSKINTKIDKKKNSIKNYQ